jgi:hypothetical protein
MPDTCWPGRPSGLVRRFKIIERLLRHYQVPLGIADQMLHHALGFRISGVAEIGPEPVMGGKRT